MKTAIDFVKERGGLISAKGSSMLPALGEPIKVRVVPVAKPKIGDIIVFKKNGPTSGPGSLTCHRVIARHSRGKDLSIIEKGDNTHNASEITHDSIVGKVIEIIDRSGKKIDVAIWKRRSLFPFFHLFNFFYNTTLVILEAFSINKKNPAVLKICRPVFGLGIFLLHRATLFIFSSKDLLKTR